MAFDPNFPPHGAGLVSQDWRDQFNALKALLDQLAQQIPPVGTIKAWAKDFPNTPPLGPNWAECNGEVLHDAESPYDGQALPDLNGAQRFLRGAGASGGTGGSDTMNLGGETDVDNNHDASTTSAASAPQPDLSILPSYYEVVWVVRVK